jgi:hypothetical protein
MLWSDQIVVRVPCCARAKPSLRRRPVVSLETIERLEGMEGELKVRLETLSKIKAALEKAGVEFVPENGSGPGVRLAKRGKQGKSLWRIFGRESRLKLFLVGGFYVPEFRRKANRKTQNQICW